MNITIKRHIGSLLAPISTYNLREMPMLNDKLILPHEDVSLEIHCRVESRIIDVINNVAEVTVADYLEVLASSDKQTRIVVGTIDASDIKRCYIAGAEIEVKCPNCGEMLRHDLGDQYLSYPSLPGTDTAYFYCGDGCDNEYEMPIKLSAAEVTVTFNPKDIEEQ